MDFEFFTSNSNRKGKDGAPLTVRSIERLLKSIVNDELHIPVHASTHMLRKTFAYHFLMAAPDRNRALELLSMQLNHRAPPIPSDISVSPRMKFLIPALD